MKTFLSVTVIFVLEGIHTGVVDFLFRRKPLATEPKKCSILFHLRSSTLFLIGIGLRYSGSDSASTTHYPNERNANPDSKA